MKQKIFLSFIAAVFGVLSTAAQNAEQIVVNAGNAEHINIASDMDVVLLAGDQADQSISLNAEATKSLSLKLSNNSLAISPLKAISRKERLKVYLYVNNPKTISVEHNSLVKTVGVIDAPKLEVFVDTDAIVHLKTTGDIKASSLSDTEVHIKYLSDNRIVKR